MLRLLIFSLLGRQNPAAWSNWFAIVDYKHDLNALSFPNLRIRPLNFYLQFKILAEKLTELKEVTEQTSTEAATQGEFGACVYDSAIKPRKLLKKQRM